LRKAGKIRTSSGASLQVANQYPRHISLTVFRIAVGYVNDILLSETTPGTYKGNSIDGGADVWEFTLTGGLGLWSLNCQSATVEGGLGGYNIFSVVADLLPLDARNTDGNWYLEDADPGTYFDELEIKIRPAPPNNLPQTS
jgi:hypothetical protein